MLTRKEIEERLTCALHLDSVRTDSYCEVLETAQQLAEWLEVALVALVTQECGACPHNGVDCHEDEPLPWPCDEDELRAREWLKGEDL